MYHKLIQTFFVVVLSVTIVRAQNDDCPTIPLGLIGVSSLEWHVANESARVTIGNDNQSDYLRIILIWDLFSGELKTVADEKAVEALRLVDQLDISDIFFTTNDASHLSLSTIHGSEYALYIPETPLKSVFSANIDTLEVRELGFITENLSDLNVIWYATDGAIIVVEPIYGPGFWSYDVCLDGSCFIDLNQFLGYLAERPELNSRNNLLATYDPGSSRISVVSLEDKALEREYRVEYQLMQGINPLWSEDERFIYFLGFDNRLVDLLVYRLDLKTGNTDVLTTLGSGEYFVKAWLLLPEHNIVIWLDTELHIQCYD